MDFNHYCKNCGRKVKEIMVDGPRIFQCECMDRVLNFNEVIAGFTKNARINQLKAMHDLMCEANDEGIYMRWIYLMPDCPSDVDFEDIAIDDKLYNECFDLFVKLIAKEGNRY